MWTGPHCSRMVLRDLEEFRTRHLKREAIPHVLKRYVRRYKDQEHRAWEDAKHTIGLEPMRCMTKLVIRVVLKGYS